ncbi:trypsin-2 [Episyrphus balteatus]|uniref:trypsin-2 n=1 Tax=Episyrphus balteatus TaxID=286459 RepID=UPI002486B4B5|nr:trypsin-2 [Episyrphus balteatus]
MGRMCWTIFLIPLLIENSLSKSANVRIVNGKIATAGEFTYQLSLRRNSKHICGASVLNNQWAISAAHCVENKKNTYSIRAGTHKRTSGGTIMNVKEILIHPQYNPETMNYDVSLLQTQNTLRGDFITPIVLPDATQPILPNVPAVVSGWGHTSSADETLPEELKYAQVYTLDQQECANMLKDYGVITNAMFCASEEQVDACQGDSGGPLNLNGVLIGVVSWGIGCADPDFPGVYTRLAYPPVRNWIKITTKL